ncbi:MAG: polyprenol monophosphomannose synthase [Proteobacteria bacterium]|nr:polyprenol monophosphomannose synthase [Pseudomonadota bacterium]
MKELLIVLPVINEKQNLEKMIPPLLKYLEGRGAILCIDDNSTDGTDAMFAELMKKNSNVFYIRNPRRIGLGNVYKMGAEFAIKNGYKWMQHMDADLSHRVEDLKNFDVVKDSADLIIGSRYIKGGKILNWPFNRLFMSSCANLYARTILGCCRIHDLTGGFNRTKTDVLKSINFKDIKSNGYASQVELKYRAYKKGYIVKEVPITFSDRELGKTKMNKAIILEGMWKIWWMRFNI